MADKVKFVVCLHSHQPVGNFEQVFEEVYNQSYLPFLQTFANYKNFKIALHYSGPLLEWLTKNKPDYMEMLKQMAKLEQVELIGGAFYEPILPLLPTKDRIEQINFTAHFFQKHFKTKPKGMWPAERVWEQSLVSDLANAKVEFTMVDNTHFNFAGIEGDVGGYYLAEDRGKTVKIFPLNEKLRYLIPFADPSKTIEYLKTFLEKTNDEAIVIYGDDGEKFGSWPGTHQLIYKEKWLQKFIEEVLKNNDWLEITSFENILKQNKPVSLAYLPDSSYREMMQWVLTPQVQEQLKELNDIIKDKPYLSKFVKGGSYRNFREKYNESYLMYIRMIELSNKVKTKEQKRYLHKAQCNCAYWHGVFGGIYLPHLRNAIYENIIKGENLLYPGIIRVGQSDIDKDGYPEYIFSSKNFKFIVDADKGGRLIAFDLKQPATNLAATFTRQKEPYHKYVFSGGKQNEMKGVHDIPKVKEQGLEKFLVYDSYQRYSLIEHMLVKIPKPEDINTLNFNINKPFIERELTGNRFKNVLKLKDGKFGINKHFEYDDNLFSVEYKVERQPETPYFAIEWNLFTLSPTAPDKWFSKNNQFIGNAGFSGSLTGDNLTFSDNWRKFKVIFNTSKECNMVFSPLYTVNLSESGIEKIFQNSTIFFVIKSDEIDNFKLTVHISTVNNK
jgi:alpha-amylase